jgi:hypothetical protein
MKPKSASTTTMIKMIQRMLIQLLPWVVRRASSAYGKETVEASRWLRPNGRPFPLLHGRSAARAENLAVREAVVAVAGVRSDVLEVGGCERDALRAAAVVRVAGLRALAATVGPLEGSKLDAG